MVWDDLPLLKYEAEVFVHTGAWLSIEHLEESLILQELFLLYRACANEFSKNLKAMAIVQGAEGVDLDEDWYDPQAITQKTKSIEMYDMPGMASSGLSLGYESLQ